MSLLMKALANAEENKRALIQQARNDDSEQQQAAANIFTASQHPNASFSMLINGLIVLIIIGIFWFSYKLYQLNQIPDNLAVNSLSVKQPIAQGRLTTKTSTRPVTTTVPPKVKLTEPVITFKNSNGAPAKKAETVKPERKITKISTAEKSKPTKPTQTVATGKIDAFSETPDLAPTADATTAKVSNTQPTGPTQIKVEHKAGDIVLDQRLQNAYQAFVSGDPAKAKSLYRSVLKQDIYQTDALLGMAAIAQKNGRYADASGWYQKALATEPNNPVALAGLAATSPTQSASNQEQRLKRLISKQPYHAQHYANLGNLYASQQSWTKAQAAFFEANRHDKSNAQFAFNLAVSLEHLGKPSLAVQHYVRALTIVKQQNLSVPDRTQIQQRLDVLQ